MININNSSKLLVTLLTNPEIFYSKKDYIFIFSHMRSYSSLLSHILGSNKDISGYAEIHQSYINWIDFLMLRYNVYQINGRSLKGRFVLDKILHNNCTVSENILRRKNINFIFMLREPESTIKSIINMFTKSQARWLKDLNSVFDYYKERLTVLEFYSKIVGKRGLFIDAEYLFIKTEEILYFLYEWLELNEKLTPKYSIFEKTGIQHYGDTSKNIMSGKIVGKTSYDYIDIPEKKLIEIKENYLNCKDILIKNCTSI